MRQLILAAMSIVLPMSLKAQEDPKMIWKDLLNQPGLAMYFSGIFDHLGIWLPENETMFTVHHHGKHFTLTDGIDSSKTDYIVALKMENMRNMQTHGADSIISEYESFKIMSVLFTPLTEAALKNRMFARKITQCLSGIENHIHVYLLNSLNAEYVAHTLIFLNKSWIVITGVHGNAKRVFRLLPHQAIDYQRHVFKATKSGSGQEWRKFRKWYIDWRKTVSSTG
jgi:hypothetical protein